MDNAIDNYCISMMVDYDNRLLVVNNSSLLLCLMLQGDSSRIVEKIDTNL